MAFNAVIETAEIAPEYVLDVLGAVWPEFPTATKFLYSVLSSKPDTSSFMNVWNTIKEKLLQNVGTEKDFVSYSGHGIVMSFANDIIALQNTSPIARQALMDDLGFAVIDSYYSDKLQPFYRISSGQINSPITNMTIDA